MVWFHFEQMKAQSRVGRICMNKRSGHPGDHFITDLSPAHFPLGHSEQWSARLLRYIQEAIAQVYPSVGLCPSNMKEASGGIQRREGCGFLFPPIPHYIVASFLKASTGLSGEKTMNRVSVKCHHEVFTLCSINPFCKYYLKQLTSLYRAHIHEGGRQVRITVLKELRRLRGVLKSEEAKSGCLPYVKSIRK